MLHPVTVDCGGSNPLGRAKYMSKKILMRCYLISAPCPHSLMVKHHAYNVHCPQIREFSGFKSRCGYQNLNNAKRNEWRLSGWREDIVLKTTGLKMLQGFESLNLLWFLLNKCQVRIVRLRCTCNAESKDRRSLILLPGSSLNAVVM